MADEPDDRAFLAGLPDPTRAIPRARRAPPAEPARAPPPLPSQVDPGAAFIGGELAAFRASVDQLRADTTAEVRQLRAELKAAHPDAKLLQALVVQAGAQAGRDAANHAMAGYKPVLDGLHASIRASDALRSRQEAQGRLLWRLVVWGAFPALLAALGSFLRAMAVAGTLAPRWSVVAGIVVGVVLTIGTWLGVKEAIDTLERRAAQRQWKAQHR